MANPISAAEASQHLRLGTLDTAEQDELNAMIDTATAMVEAFCNRPFTAATSTDMFDRFPSSPATPLVSYKDIQSLTSISYVDSSYEPQTYTTHRVVNIGGVSRIFPALGQEWPSDNCELPYNIVVTAQSGDETAVPAPVKSAILLLVGDLYENRENSVTGQGLVHVKMSLTAERLLTPYKTRLA